GAATPTRAGGGLARLEAGSVLVRVHGGADHAGAGEPVRGGDRVHGGGTDRRAADGGRGAAAGVPGGAAAPGLPADGGERGSAWLRARPDGGIGGVDPGVDNRYWAQRADV